MILNYRRLLLYMTSILSHHLQISLRTFEVYWPLILRQKKRATFYLTSHLSESTNLELSLSTPETSRLIKILGATRAISSGEMTLNIIINPTRWIISDLGKVAYTLPEGEMFLGLWMTLAGWSFLRRRLTIHLRQNIAPSISIGSSKKPLCRL